jgi:uncharacterized protein (TIGR00369 family)
MKEQPNASMCFVCGRDNPIGLKVVFAEDGDRVVAQFTPREEHQGYPGLIHGGLLSTLLDEVLARTVFFDGFWSVTVEMEIRFHHPVAIGERVSIMGEVVRRRSRMLEAHGEIRLEDGTLAAEGWGTYLKISDQMRAELEEKFAIQTRSP